MKYVSIDRTTTMIHKRSNEYDTVLYTENNELSRCIYDVTSNSIH